MNENNGIGQVVTTLKNTDKPVTEVPFPALTICGSGFCTIVIIIYHYIVCSGFHMSNVERKVGENFAKWRAEKNKKETTAEAIHRDIKEYMTVTFQIKPKEDMRKGSKPANILDILDTMIASDVDASVAANSIRENVMACENEKSPKTGDDHCALSCSNPAFSVSGSKCFHVPTSQLNFANAVTSCQGMGSKLATISDSTEDEMVWNLMSANGAPAEEDWTYIGLNDIQDEGDFLWQDGSSLNGYTNWYAADPNGGTQHNCVIKGHSGNGKWSDVDCTEENRYACSLEAQQSCDTEKTLESALHQRTCIQPNTTSIADPSPKLPRVDIFLNPGKEQERRKVVSEQKRIAVNFFANANMSSLYPELFRILWESTVPCFEAKNNANHMLFSCELAGVKINCSELFTRVATDTGMCCALNVEDSLRESEYSALIKDLQGETRIRKVESQEGRKNGLRLTLDLHSNKVSFGSLDQQYSAFNLFIGRPAQFPMMRDKSIQLQPGREHFVDLSATVVSTNGIRDILPEARECFFTDEGDLEFYKRYTFSNCRLECGIKKAEQQLGCIPWHLPKVRRTKSS